MFIKCLKNAAETATGTAAANLRDPSGGPGLCRQGVLASDGTDPFCGGFSSASVWVKMIPK